MANKQVVVLLYDGPEPNKSMLLDISNAVMGVGGSDAEVYVLTDGPESNADTTPIEHAIAYIGEAYADLLSTKGSIDQFAAKITVDLAKAKYTSGGDEKLLKAAEILSTRSGRISRGIMTKYGFNRDVFLKIKAAYNAV